MPSEMQKVVSGDRSSEVYRISGHQTFALRIAWIPKAVREISRHSDPFTNVDEGNVRLGLGKNMVKSLRVWIEAFQVSRRGDDCWRLTPLAERGKDNSLSRVINARFSPGRIFKMSETEIALRLADLAGQQRKIFFVTDSAHLRQIGRAWSLDRIAALRAAHVSPT